MNSTSADAYIEEESFPKSPITAAFYRDPALAQWAEPGGLTVSFYYVKFRFPQNGIKDLNVFSQTRCRSAWSRRCHTRPPSETDQNTDRILTFMFI